MILSLVSLSACASAPKKNSIPGLFDTKLEAEKAAENFNCIGAHQMGEKWMPCKQHVNNHNHNQHHHNH